MSSITKKKVDILKTRLTELLSIKRDDIEFVETDTEFGITISNEEFIMFEAEQNAFCCGILELGESVIREILENLSQLEKNILIVECMNKIHTMVKRNTSIRQGIVTFSHITTNPIVIALKSDNNTEDMPWKLVSEFHNPNSNNTVCYFIARLVD